MEKCKLIASERPIHSNRQPRQGRPIRGQYPGHVITLYQSEATYLLSSSVPMMFVGTCEISEEHDDDAGDTGDDNEDSGMLQ